MHISNLNIVLLVLYGQLSGANDEFYRQVTLERDNFVAQRDHDGILSEKSARRQRPEFPDEVTVEEEDYAVSTDCQGQCAEETATGRGTRRMRGSPKSRVVDAMLNTRCYT